MAAAPELIPEEVTIAEALPVVGALCAFSVCLGIIFVIDAFTRGLFSTVNSTVGWIPFVNKVVAWPIHRIEQKLTNYLGNAEHYFDAKIASSWHKLGLIVARLGAEIEGLALDLVVAAGVIATLWKPKEIVHVIRGHVRPLRILQHTDRLLIRQARAQERAIEHFVHRHLSPRVHAIEHEIDHVLEPEYESLRERTLALEHGLSRAWRAIRHANKPAVSKAFLAAVGLALAELGGGWIRCRNWKRIGRHVCNLPLNLIEDLLGVAFDALLLHDLCQMVGVIQGIARKVAPEINALVLEVEGFICGGHQSAPSAIVDSDWQRVPALPSGIVAFDLQRVTD